MRMGSVSELHSPIPQSSGSQVLPQTLPLVARAFARYNTKDAGGAYS